MQYPHWIKYPRLGTSFLNGRYMVTLRGPYHNYVAFAVKDNDHWVDDDGEQFDGEVIAVAFVPKPYMEPEPSEIGSAI